MDNFKGMDMMGKKLKSFLLFMWASEGLRGRITNRLATDGLTMSQFGVLNALYHLGPRSQRDLGKGIFKSSGNMTKVVDNLERNGLVERVRSEEDRRYYLVHLTPKGRKLFETALPRHIQAVEDEMSKLSEKERGILNKICVKIGGEG